MRTNAFYSNRIVETSGLKFCVDACPPVDVRIRIPASMEVETWASISSAEENVDDEDGSEFSNGPRQKMVNVSNEVVTIHRGSHYIRHNCRSTRVCLWSPNPISQKTIKAFIAANADHVRADEIGQENILWVHAIRYWSVVAGMVDSNSSSEFVEVEDPDEKAIQAVSSAHSSFVYNYPSQAFSALAAKGARWRNSGDVAGGLMATGWVRRWLESMGYWSNNGQFSDATGCRDADDENVRASLAFSIATHAAGVHPILAMLAPDDDDHFALVRPRWGILHYLHVNEASRAIMTDKLQVADTSVVVEAVGVLARLVAEGKTNGIKVAPYSSWFLQGHPAGNRTVPFNQKCPKFSALVGELAAVAVRYHPAIPAALLAAEAELCLPYDRNCLPYDRNRWAVLGQVRSETSNEVAIGEKGEVLVPYIAEPWFQTKERRQRQLLE
ncbi:hypothetical protein MCOR02_004922 [Pyricularia oryzae]|nr:hypothetical protein MCOR02_004922 [Pyricularia oryzae]KAI6301355.1 hypothetical protein MCOR34_009006 [Pyricularia oryzae]KAI6448129.1 hypothetical protein MCOR17_010395 [Pyricularia oryzae]KAI6554238.1 hypothetical protein MCOR04_010599 [Pyricularia oryzae]